MNLSEFPPVDLKTIDRNIKWGGSYADKMARCCNPAYGTALYVREFDDGWYWRCHGNAMSQTWQKLGARTLEEAQQTALVLWRMR